MRRARVRRRERIVVWSITRGVELAIILVGYWAEEFELG